MKIGFLHTAEVHVETFRGLVRDIDPSIGTVEIVDESLLDRARTAGIDDDSVTDGTTARLNELAGAEASVIVCTCSTIAGVAERIGAPGVVVLRVDRPMAERAVDIGGRVGVVAALVSTLAPTRALVEHVAADKGAQVTLSEHLVADAWQHFEAGDTAAYLNSIARELERMADNVDVVVLAQASWAAAADQVDLRIEVLSSPALAVKTAVAALRTISDADR